MIMTLFARKQTISFSCKSRDVNGSLMTPLLSHFWPINYLSIFRNMHILEFFYSKKTSLFCQLCQLGKDRKPEAGVVSNFVQTNI